VRLLMREGVVGLLGMRLDVVRPMVGRLWVGILWVGILWVGILGVWKLRVGRLMLLWVLESLVDH